VNKRQDKYFGSLSKFERDLLLINPKILSDVSSAIFKHSRTKEIFGDVMKKTSKDHVFEEQSLGIHYNNLIETCSAAYMLGNPEDILRRYLIDLARDSKDAMRLLYLAKNASNQSVLSPEGFFILTKHDDIIVPAKHLPVFKQRSEWKSDTRNPRTGLIFLSGYLKKTRVYSFGTQSSLKSIADTIISFDKQDKPLFATDLEFKIQEYYQNYYASSYVKRRTGYPKEIKGVRIYKIEQR
jgi:hypothetical protein